MRERKRAHRARLSTAALVTAAAVLLSCCTEPARPAERDDLIEAIWPAGLPDAVPVSTRLGAIPAELGAVDPAAVAAVDRLDIDVDGLASTAYLLTAPNAVGRLGIVHGGHQVDQPAKHLADGLAAVVNGMLDRGLTVAVMQMPLSSWNRDRTGTNFTLQQAGTAGHNELFAKQEPAMGAEVLRYFIEPVVQVLNGYATPGTVMTGLSGGGWTTHVAAAIDTRIELSVPVAGSLPNELRPPNDGDAEQMYPPVFAEDGIAPWVTVYELGATGIGRRQIQVLNRYDPCCFGGTAHQAYSTDLHARLMQWSVFVDTSHTQHQVSPVALALILGSL